MLIAVTYLLPKGVHKEMLNNCKGYEVIKTLLPSALFGRKLFGIENLVSFQSKLHI